MLLLIALETGVVSLFSSHSRPVTSLDRPVSTSSWRALASPSWPRRCSCWDEDDEEPGPGDSRVGKSPFFLRWIIYKWPFSIIMVIIMYIHYLTLQYNTIQYNTRHDIHNIKYIKYSRTGRLQKLESSGLSSPRNKCMNSQTASSGGIYDSIRAAQLKYENDC